MEVALTEAKRALDDGEVPVGAIVVMGGEIVGWGRNSVIRMSDPTAHAEILALREAAQRVKNYRLPGADIYVTLEPCIMCAGAIISARVRRLIYGAEDIRGGAVDSIYKLLGDERLNHRVEVTAGILEEESLKLIKGFFKNRR